MIFEKKTNYQKTLIFCQEKPSFFVKKQKCVFEYLKRREKRIDRRFKPTTSGFQSAVTPDTCILQDTNDSADLWTLRVEGNFRTKRKKSRPLVWTISNLFSNKFSTKNGNFDWFLNLTSSQAGKRRPREQIFATKPDPMVAETQKGQWPNQICC